MVHTINLKYINYCITISIIFGSSYTNTYSKQVFDQKSSYTYTNGYLDEALNVDFTSEHALNIPKYLTQNLWPNYSKEMNEAEQFIATDMLSDEAISWVTHAGYRIIWQKPLRFHFIGVVDYRNTLSILILNLGGYESLLKIQLLVRAATNHNPIFLTIRRKTNERVNYKTIINALPRADLVIYGYANTIMSHILQHASSKELKHVPQSLISHLKNTTAWVGNLNSFRPLYVLHTETGKTIWIVSNVYGNEAKWLVESI
ncbi:unnamed protein product, partial [Adineta ricciae]